MMNDFEDDAKAGPSWANGPLKLWWHNGKFYLNGLFKMHDQEGFPLADSLAQCRLKGFEPCLTEWKMDAIRAGWPKEKIETYLAQAIRDSRY